jgi:hypothetical protein
MTNYPNTIDTNLRWKELVQYEMFGKGKEVENLIELDFTQYNAPHPLIVNNVASKVKLTVNQMKLDFFMQPTMRIVNFLTAQLLPIFAG